MGDKLLPKEYEAAAVVLKGRLVKFDAAGKIVQASAATDNIIGVAATGVDAAELAAGKDRIRVEHLGKEDVTAGAAILPGVPITSDAAGKAVGAAATNRTAGFAIEEATGDNDIIGCFISPSSR